MFAFFMKLEATGQLARARTGVYGFSIADMVDWEVLLSGANWLRTVVGIAGFT